jgi:WD40 repeat protein
LDFGKVSDTLSAHTDDVTDVKYYKNQLLSGSKDSSVRLWKSYSNGTFAKVPIIEFEEHESKVTTLNFDYTGNIAVSGGSDGYIILYDLRTKQSIKRFVGHNYAVTGLSFLGNDGNRIISCSLDKSIRIHDTQGNVLSSFDANEPLK